MATQTATLEMVGFGCASCAYAIERLARRHKGIHSIHVSLAAGEIAITYDPDVIDAPATVLAHIQKIGHDARMKRPPHDQTVGGG